LASTHLLPHELHFCPSANHWGNPSILLPQLRQMKKYLLFSMAGSILR
jgi:hypothetical protein